MNKQPKAVVGRVNDISLIITTLIISSTAGRDTTERGKLWKVIRESTDELRQHPFVNKSNEISVSYTTASVTLSSGTS